MVGFDANFLMIALRPEIPASVDRAKARVLKLLDDLQGASERIIIPTPALAEFLVHADRAATVYLEELQKSSRFVIRPFGIRAAVEVSSQIASAVTKKDKRDGSRDTWAKVNFDRQIASITKVEGAHAIYTDDPGLATFAEKIGLTPISLADLDYPDPTLFDALDDENENEGTENEKPETQSLSAPVSGGSIRLAEGKTAAAGAEAEAAEKDEG